MIVLDASVVLKWIFGDEDKEGKAGLFRDGHLSGKEIIAVPDLFFFEIANVLSTKTRLNAKDAAEAFSFYGILILRYYISGGKNFLMQ